MTEPVQSASVQPGILHRQKEGIDETGSHVVGSLQATGVAVGLATTVIVAATVGVVGRGIVNEKVN